MKISSGVEGIARIEIQKRIDLIQVIIYMGFPRIDLIQVIIYMGFPKLLAEGKPQSIEELHMNLQKEFNYVNRKLKIAITRITKPYGHPKILAKFIVGQLRNRVSFRKAIKKAIELTEQRIQKEFKSKLQGVLTEKKLHVSNGLEKEGFPYKPFELKLIIVPIE